MFVCICCKHGEAQNKQSSLNVHIYINLECLSTYADQVNLCDLFAYLITQFAHKKYFFFIPGETDNRQYFII